MTDRELLEKLFAFMVKRSFVLGTEPSIRDMVNRYSKPPLTLHYPCCMQMTKNEYEALGNLLKKIAVHLNPEPAKEVTDEPA
jgi:hypothetical protein